MTSQPTESSIGPTIVRILAGTGTPTDEADLRQWLAADPGRGRELDELQAIWNEAGALHRDWDTTGLRQRILGAGATRVTPLRSPGYHPGAAKTWLALSVRWSRTWLSLASAAAVLVVVGVFAWRAAVGRRTRAGIDQVRFTEIATRRGQQATLQLSDGTRITLGVDSRLRYPETFARGAGRDVYLEGEAYFEVAHDTARPFQVHAGDAVVRVLGTRFGVRAYTEDRNVRVVVAEGKVGIGRGAAVTDVLDGGDLGTLGAGRPAAIQRGVNVRTYLAWVDGQLVFADTPLGEVAQQLSRWYNLDVRLGDSARTNTPFTMSLRGDEPPDKVLKVVADAVGGRLERRGTAYVILSRASKAP